MTYIRIVPFICFLCCIFTSPFAKHIEGKNGIYHHIKDSAEENGEIKVLCSFTLRILQQEFLELTVKFWKTHKMQMMPMEVLQTIHWTQEISFHSRSFKKCFTQKLASSGKLH